MIYSNTKKKKDKVKARCQCLPQCKNPPLENLPFCKEHLRYCPRIAPLSGYETEFNPDRYNKFKGIKESHNCYAYAFDYMKLPNLDSCTKESCPISFPQPGRASGYPKWSDVKGKRCPDLVSRLIGDVPGIKRATFEQKCPKRMRKIALVADEKEDYHFFRQDLNKKWSHKPGATDVSDLDATKRPIYDPQLASREYPDSGLNYNKFCGYLCIPANTRHKLRRSGGGKKKYTKKRR
jgi:hypothetical protein